MPEEKDANELISMPVFGTSEGRELGRVKDVLFDPDRQMLLGLVVQPVDDDALSFVERDGIIGLGRDAVTVEGGEALRPLATEERARTIVDSGIHIGGAKVITESGDAIGQIDRVMLDNDGAIVGYRAVAGPFGIGGKNRIDPRDVRKIGADAVIVAAHVGRQDEGDDEDEDDEQTTRRKSGVVADRRAEEHEYRKESS